MWSGVAKATSSLASVAGEGAAGRRGEWIGGVLEVVLEVGRVEIDLVGGEDFKLMLLEGERGEGAAGEIVVLAAILHGGPVADGGSPDLRGRLAEGSTSCLRVCAP